METLIYAAGFAAAGAVGGICWACWRLQSSAGGFVANLRAVLRTGGQGEER